MSLRDTRRGWGVITISLHWLMAVLIFGMLALGFWMAEIEGDLVNRYLQTQFHKSIGALILMLGAMRLCWRLTARARPPLPDDTPQWQARAAFLSHAARCRFRWKILCSGCSPCQILFRSAMPGSRRASGGCTWS
jgi:cytochrome b561